MSKHNISEMADANSGSLVDQYKILRKRYNDHGILSILDSFITFIEKEWSVSINMDLLAIHGFLTSGKYKNVYEFIDDSANVFDAKDDLDKNKALKGLLKNWTPKRIAFDSCFNNSEKIQIWCNQRWWNWIG